MRIFIALLIVLLFYSKSLISQEAWERITPKPQENNITSIIKIPGTDRLMAVCNGSTIITSDDGGEIWDLHFNPGGMYNDFNMSCITFFNDTLGFILGNYYSILKTIDGGETWTLKYSEPSENYYWYLLNDIDFVNQLTGFSVGSSGKFLRTDNGGETWLEIESGTTQPLEEIEFFSEDVGIIPFYDYQQGTGKVIKTVNGGDSWNIHSNPLGIASDMHISDVRKLTETTALMNTSILDSDSWTSYIYRSTDAGHIWHPEGSFEGVTGDFAFYDTLKSVISNYIFPSDGRLFQTIDGGDSWQVINSEYYGSGIISYYNESELVYVGGHGTVGKSYDGGLTWESKSVMTMYRTIHEADFIDGIGYAIGHGWAGSINYELLKSTDGGVTWDQIDHGIECGDMDYISNDTGLIIGNWGAVTVYTTDGWETKSFCGIDIDAEDIDDMGIKFLSRHNAVAYVGDSILSSVNNTFSSWTGLPRLTFSGVKFKDIEARSDVEAIVVGGIKGSDSTILVKVTIGEPFQLEEIIPGEFGQANDILFINDSIGFIGTSKNVILKTVDGGLTWNPSTINSTNSLEVFELQFPSEEIGYATGFGQFHNMLKTIDGGNTWFPLITNETSSLTDINFTDENNGYIYGESGLIMHTTSGGVVAVKDIPGNEKYRTAASPFLIVPNPVKDYCHVELVTFPASFPMVMTITDLAGKSLRDFVINNESAPINLRNLSQGAYIVKITNNKGDTGCSKLIKD